MAELTQRERWESFDVSNAEIAARAAATANAAEEMARPLPPGPDELT